MTNRGAAGALGGIALAVDHILGTPGLSDGERVAMLGETAAQLLGIKASRRAVACRMG
jgi:hypothetical protein